MSLLLRNNITLLVSDMAGTVINEKGLIYISLKKTLKRLGYCVSDADMKSWHGRDKKEVLWNHIYKQYDPPGVKYLAPKVNEAEKLLVEELEKSYFEDKNIELIDDGLLDFFDSLRINGVKVALNTGYPKDFQNKIIDYFDLGGRVDTWISSEEVAQGRPAPYMIHQLMERCDIPSVKNVAKIGDTVNDMREGINAGCGLTIGVLSGADNKDDLMKYSNLVINKITDLNEEDVPVFLL